MLAHWTMALARIGFLYHSQVYSFCCEIAANLYLALVHSQREGPWGLHPARYRSIVVYHRFHLNAFFQRASAGSNLGVNLDPGNLHAKKLKWGFIGTWAAWSKTGSSYTKARLLSGCAPAPDHFLLIRYTSKTKSQRSCRSKKQRCKLAIKHWQTWLARHFTSGWKKDSSLTCGALARAYFEGTSYCSDLFLLIYNALTHRICTGCPPFLSEFLSSVARYLQRVQKAWSQLAGRPLAGKENHIGLGCLPQADLPFEMQLQ